MKTHKATAKRVFFTKGGNKKKGKAIRQSRQNRKQRFSRGTNSKATNTDTKSLKLSDVASKKVKKLLAS